MNFVWLLVTILSIKYGSCFLNCYGYIIEESYRGDPGEPLMLTPLIKQNKINLARNLSEVHLDELPNLISYSGYLTVNEEFNSNLFFWFFPSKDDYLNNPVVLWLQGGPGATSMIGLFTENGPIWIDKKSKLRLRQYSWNVDHSIIFIDNPVGTGYSFTDVGGYAQNQTIIGNQLYVALLQFFQLFPELQKNHFFVAGESYAGKYVPAVSYAIHQNNPTANQKINLQGLLIGNGLSDPEHQLQYSSYLYQIGLIDTNSKRVIQQREDTIVQLIKQNKYLEAFQVFNNLILGDPTFFKNVTGFSNHFNYLIADDVSGDMERMGKFIQDSDTRSRIHVGNAKFHSGDVVEDNLASDVMKSVAPWISELLSYYRVLIYNGQLDIIVAYPLTLNYLQNLQFSATDDYKIAERHQWSVDGTVAGYFKQAGNLTEFLIRNAGHMVPKDQPGWAWNLLKMFTSHRIF